MKSLSANRDLAETLVGVIGDILPAEKVVSMRFLSKLFVGLLQRDKTPDLLKVVE